jgi:predicted nucleotidyltransferase
MNRNLIILKEIKTNLGKVFGERLYDVILFGSRTRKKSQTDSDFDVLIILNDHFEWMEKNKIRDICYDIALEYEIIIDSKIIALPDIKNKFWGKHPLITDAIQNGIHA